MQSLITTTRPCPVAGRVVRVEEIYLVQGTGSCQIDTQLIHLRCLDQENCPDPALCPLYLDDTASDKEVQNKDD